MLEKGGRSYTVQERESVALRCTADGIPIPSITWLRSGVVLQTGLSDEFQVVEQMEPGYREDIPEAVMNVLTIFNVTGADSGSYSCRASNGIGRVALLEQEFQLFVTPGMCVCQRFHLRIDIVITLPYSVNRLLC